jgi:hypothetical protein
MQELFEDDRMMVIFDVDSNHPLYKRAVMATRICWGENWSRGNAIGEFLFTNEYANDYDEDGNRIGKHLIPPYAKHVWNERISEIFCRVDDKFHPALEILKDDEVRNFSIFKSFE